MLYPADASPSGQELRLRQEYFFTSASLQDILRRHRQQYGVFENLPDKVAVQLNDTHPAVGVAELMRLLMDDHGLAFAEAWDLTRRTIGYTNHTLLPEALETLAGAAVRAAAAAAHADHLRDQHRACCARRATLPGSTTPRSAASALIDETGERRVRMGNLAFVGAHSINGVSALHSEL